MIDWIVSFVAVVCIDMETKKANNFPRLLVLAVAADLGSVLVVGGVLGVLGFAVGGAAITVALAVS